MRVWVAAAIAVLAVTHGVTRALATGNRCMEVGSTYRPNPEGRDEPDVYRLHIVTVPPADDPLGENELWDFRVLDRRNARVLVTLRLLEHCPTGGNCDIALRTGDRSADYYSEIIRLTDGFRQATDWSAPRAIVLPGFADHPWPPTGHPLPPTALSSTTPMHRLDLHDRIIWMRLSCGRG